MLSKKPKVAGRKKSPCVSFSSSATATACSYAASLKGLDAVLPPPGLSSKKKAVSKEVLLVEHFDVPIGLSQFSKDSFMLNVERFKSASRYSCIYLSDDGQAYAYLNLKEVSSILLFFLLGTI